MTGDFGTSMDAVFIPKRLVEKQIAIATTIPINSNMTLLVNIIITDTFNRPEK